MSCSSAFIEPTGVKCIVSRDSNENWGSCAAKLKAIFPWIETSELGFSSTSSYCEVSCQKL